MERSGRAWFKLIVGLFVMSLAFAATLAGIDFWRPPGDARRVQRVGDLTNLRDALVAYKNANGSYPISINGQWSGRHNAWGPEADDWIPGLSPQYIKVLPRDPRLSDNGDEQYLYKSNGKDFKVIVTRPENDCPIIARDRPDLLDPQRGFGGDPQCWAYGYWTEGAAGW